MPTDDRLEALADRLEVIEEELRDVAYERLAAAAGDPDGEDARAAVADEKRCAQARRAVARAVAALRS